MMAVAQYEMCNISTDIDDETEVIDVKKKNCTLSTLKKRMSLHVRHNLYSLPRVLAPNRTIT